MRYRSFGTTGWQVSEIGFGAWQIGGDWGATDDAESIRTLHHYDRLGLLHPTTHSEAGYRFYSEGDLLALHQILTLRYLGFQ